MNSRFLAAAAAATAASFPSPVAERTAGLFGNRRHRGEGEEERGRELTRQTSKQTAAAAATVRIFGLECARGIARAQAQTRSGQRSSDERCMCVMCADVELVRVGMAMADAGLYFSLGRPAAERFP